MYMDPNQHHLELFMRFEAILFLWLSCYYVSCYVKTLIRFFIPSVKLCCRKRNKKYDINRPSASLIHARSVSYHHL